MPAYDLHCPTCEKTFNTRATMAEKAEKRIPCPTCGSIELETVFKPVAFHVKSEAAPACPNAHICGAGCHHAH